MLQDQLQRERQESQPQIQAPPNISSSGPKAKDLAYFKSDMTSLIRDMIQSSLSTFASQLKRRRNKKILIPSLWPR